MYRNYFKILAFTLVLGSFMSCNRAPKHASLIPQDALMVADINTKELSKKIAWEFITNPDFWQRIKIKSNKKSTGKQSDFISNMQEAGVDELNTFYLYLKNASASEIQNEAVFVALIPLKDAEKFDKFVKQNFDGTQVLENGKRKEAQLSDQIYAGWNANLLILISVQLTHPQYSEDDTTLYADQIPTKEVMQKYLNEAFSVNDQNTILSDKRFEKWQSSNHDLGFWINVEELMNRYGNQNLGSMTGGVTVGSKLWENSAFTAASHFEKGELITDMSLYSSDDLKEINSKYPPKPVDHEMVERMTNKELDYLMAFNFNPEATIKTLEKLGLLGVINGMLINQGLRIEEILEGFTGDLALSVSNFKQDQELLLFDSSDESSSFVNYKLDKDILFVIKIKNQAIAQKWLKFGETFGLMTATSNNAYKINTNNAQSEDLIQYDKDYILYSNKAKLANGFFKNTIKEKNSLISNHVPGNPMAVILNIDALTKRNPKFMNDNAPDSTLFAITKNMFEDIIIKGGRVKDNRSDYQMIIQLKNKKQGSLEQFITYAQQLKVINDAKDSLINAQRSAHFEDL